MRTPPHMQLFYFLLGFTIAAALVLLTGCQRGEDDLGRPCVGILGMTIEGEQCEDIVYPEPEPVEPEPVYCCMALIPSCMACADRCSVDEWLEKTCGPGAVDAEYAGWDEEKNEPIWLCQVEIIN